jgi:ATP-dependent protease HslVU (ClpYQ) peptidase subunit
MTNDTSLRVGTARQSLCARAQAKLSLAAGDGQVSVGQTAMKGTARKVRRLTAGGSDDLYLQDRYDAFTLLERLE